MTRPILAAQSSYGVVPNIPWQQQIPTDKDWEARRSEIEHLYVLERQKLKFVMRYMEKKHNFKAT